MGGSCLAERLSHHIVLADAERDALDALEEQRRHVRRGAVIIEEGQPSRELYIVQKGWLQSSVLLGNGGRQIMRINLSGDVLGLAALAFEEAPETVTALTDVTLCPFDREKLGRLFIDHPRSIDETYSEHFGVAARFGLTMIRGGLCAIVHAVVAGSPKSNALMSKRGEPSSSR